MNTLETYGWNNERKQDWEALEAPQFTPARIIADYGRQYKVALPEECIAQLSGALTHKLTANDMPKIGDWVAIELADNQPPIIQAVLPRSSEIVRGHVGDSLISKLSLQMSTSLLLCNHSIMTSVQNV